MNQRRKRKNLKRKNKKMSLLRKKCEYCKRKIEKGEETLRSVKDPVFVGTREKAFCCSEHADDYEKEVLNAKKSSGGCCG